MADTAPPPGPVGITPGPALTVAQIDRHGDPSPDVYTAGFFGTEQDSVVRGILGKSARGGADLGEVLSLCASVTPGDAMSWFDAWQALGDRIAATASTSAARGHRVSAARAYLRAADYLALAVNAADGLSGDSGQLLPAFREHVQTWDGFVANTRWPAERVDIPYEGGSMPG